MVKMDILPTAKRLKMYTLPTAKKFKRQTRLETAAARIRGLSVMLERTLKLQVELYGALKFFANGSNWGKSDDGVVMWLGDNDPVQLAQDVLDYTTGEKAPEAVRMADSAITDAEGD